MRLSGELAIVELRSSIRFKDYRTRNYTIWGIDVLHVLWLQSQLELFQGLVDEAPFTRAGFAAKECKRIIHRRVHRRV